MITCYFEKGNKADNGSLRHAVVDALVIKDDRILLVKRADGILEAGKWALVGGFVEPNETLVQTVEREVFEETGYKVSDVCLLTIRDNPDRPHEDRQNIAFVFVCNAQEKEGESDWEVVEQTWFSFDALPPEEQIAFDHMKNIQLYQEHKAKGLSLPILQY
jgi:ADP-ribose pyrophosphatase YjhB (NUDIX family)